MESTLMLSWSNLLLTLSCIGVATRLLLFLLPNLTRSRTQSRQPQRRPPLPPGPCPLPILGSLLKLGDQPHRSLATLARTHGPLMTVRLGSVTVVVVSSPWMARQVLQKHDQALSDRAVPDCLRALDHGKLSVAWMPAVDSDWRLLRKICNTELFTARRLDASQGLRCRKVRELLAFVGGCARDGKPVDVGQAAFATTLNLISSTLFSVDVVRLDLESADEFKNLVRSVMEEVGSPNLADYFPVLRWVDPQGRRRRMTSYLKKLHRLFDEIIDVRLRSRRGEPASTASSGDFLDVLLDCHGGKDDCPRLSLETIKSLLVDMFVAGSDTSSNTTEWAMTELLRNPEVMEKARFELEVAMKSRSTGGWDAVLVEEADIARLPFLQAVVKETLRLHPPAPLLLHRKARVAVEISTTTTDGGGVGGGDGGATAAVDYTVPEGATVLVNAWAIGRDPGGAWGDQAEAFMPKRFLEGSGGHGVEFGGWNFELIPFGAGRRICPGLPLGARMVQLMLANMLWSFRWSLSGGGGPADVDLTEKFGISLSKAVPLLAVPDRA